MKFKKLDKICVQYAHFHSPSHKCYVHVITNTAFTLSTVTNLISNFRDVALMNARLHCNNYHEMLRMALNRHKLSRYRRQRKRRTLTQLALVIAFCASLSPIIRAEREVWTLPR